jgi:electron transfer flavoprotein beta subunit
MKIIVCIKQVPATESRITLRADGAAIEMANLTYVLNPYDEFALEESLRIRERSATGVVTVMTMGPDRSQEALRTCLAMGADEAVLLRDDAFDGGDSLATARVLAEAVKGRSFDLLLFGKQAVDDDQGAVGIQVAELLDLPHVSAIGKLEVDLSNRRAEAHRRIEGGIEVVETPLPAVFTAHRELNTPRYASLPGIMKARQKAIEKIGNEALGLALKGIGAAGSRTVVKQMELPPKRAPGRRVEGETLHQVRELVRILKEEIKAL